MKKLLKFLFCTALIFISLPVFVFAQDGGTLPAGLNLGPYFVSLATLVPFVILIAGWLNKVLEPKGWVKQLISWIISLIVVFVGWFFKLGMLAEVTQIWMIFLYALACGLCANGIFDVRIVQAVLRGIKLLPKKKAQ